jgi:hypothetical protein
MPRIRSGKGERMKDDALLTARMSSEKDFVFHPSALILHPSLGHIRHVRAVGIDKI